VLAGLLSLGAATGAAAVTVTPNALYIDHRTRSGTLTLYNRGDLPEEIDIGFAYGIPQSDAEGNISVPLVDGEAQNPRSAASWLRVFPRRLTLQPGQRQVIRILVQPPADIPDGEYWARVLIRSRGGQPPIEERRGGISVLLNMETVLVTAVNYRKGAVQTGVEVKGGTARTDSEGVKLVLDLDRQGNAAYLGRVVAELVGPGDVVLAETAEPVAVYGPLRIAIPIPVQGAQVPRGAMVRYRLEASRPDLPPGSALPAPVAEGSVPVGAP
jgi:fimbrial chaperone protein